MMLGRASRKKRTDFHTKEEASIFSFLFFIGVVMKPFRLLLFKM